MSTGSTLEDVKFVDGKTKMILNGYIRTVEALLPDNNVYYTIPTLIIHWIMLYFYQKEQFDAKYCHYDIALSKDNTFATMLSGDGYPTVMLSKVIKSGIHHWRVRFIGNDIIGYIGVYKNQYVTSNMDENPWGKHKRGKLYAVGSDGRRTYGDDDELKESLYEAQKGIGSDDQLREYEMTLDLDKRELRFKFDEYDHGAVFTNIEKTEYRAFVAGAKKGQTYEILSYKCLSNGD